ncbi:unnamed protein product, partial [Ectocarpus fasciculatus]
GLRTRNAPVFIYGAWLCLYGGDLELSPSIYSKRSLPPTTKYIRHQEQSPIYRKELILPCATQLKIYEQDRPAAIQIIVLRLFNISGLDYVVIIVSMLMLASSYV